MGTNTTGPSVEENYVYRGSQDVTFLYLLGKPSQLYQLMLCSRYTKAGLKRSVALRAKGKQNSRTVEGSSQIEKAKLVPKCVDFRRLSSKTA